MVKFHILTGHLWLTGPEEPAEGQGLAVVRDGVDSDQDSSRRVKSGCSVYFEGRANSHCCKITYRVCERGVKDALKIFWLKELPEHSSPKRTTGETGFRENDMLSWRASSTSTWRCRGSLMNLRERSSGKIQRWESSA